ncbi:MAG: 3-hydroxyacyl-ACP dehydratase FabZ family protein [Flavobacteriaceae bacterium]
MAEKFQKIIAQLPYSEPFLFVDQLLELNDEGCRGRFTFKKDLDFYRGHFKDYPITPGVILTECCAQIGLACFGTYLIGEIEKDTQVVMTSSEMEFNLPVYPGQTVEVEAQKVYYRFNKLKCKVRMYNEKGELICKGVLAGMLKGDKDG